MANIVLGIGTSHGPMLVTRPEQWLQRIPDDIRNRHPWRGQQWTYDALREARSGEHLHHQTTAEIMEARHIQCQRAIQATAEVFAKSAVDVAVVVGNDQMEIYSEELIPAFGILYGDEVVNSPLSEAVLARLPPGIAESVPGYIPAQGARYPGAGELGRYLVEHVTAAGFDVAAMKRFPKDLTPHAHGFVYRRIMQDRPVPSVPVVLNTFYPPNQPSIRRCYDFGVALGKAIDAWESDARVAVIASGGLSHFVVDEELDRTLLDALATGDVRVLDDLGESIFQSGTSEVKNWLPVSAALCGRGLKFKLIDYVPVYRTDAGTGNAMAFAQWSP